jgi:hypothetical protein
MTDDFATIIPIFLEDSELEYELRIRKLRGQNTRDSRVKTLERALAKSRTVVQDPEFTLENEKKLIDDTLETIKTTISTLEAEVSVDSNIYKRISTRIAYITQRILRVSKNIKTTSEINDLTENWEAQCLELEADLIIKTKTSIRDVPSHMSLQSVGSNSSTKSVPVHKWGIHFNGHTDLIVFLEQVDDLMIARNITAVDLFNSAYDLFEGPALTWYRSIRDNVTDWLGLVSRLKVSFLPCDYDDKLWDDIKNRKQRKDESIVIYVAEMNALFSRLSTRPSADIKLKNIRRNLLPYYISALALQDVNSIDQLINLCKRIDEAYNLKRKNAQCSKVYSISVSPSMGKPIENRTSHSKCWNCGKEGHLYNNCVEKRKRFCYRCGAPDCTVRSCINCSGNFKEEH